MLPSSDDQPAGDEALIDMLAQSAFATMGALTRLASENDLSLTQLRVLAILRDRRLPMSALIEYLGLEKSTLTGLVDRAERRGLLNRARNAEDGRAVDLLLSVEGLAFAERLAADLSNALRPVTSVLEPDERDRLRDLLAKTLGEGSGSEQARPSFPAEGA